MAGGGKLTVLPVSEIKCLQHPYFPQNAVVGPNPHLLLYVHSLPGDFAAPYVSGGCTFSTWLLALAGASCRLPRQLPPGRVAHAGLG